MGSTMKNAEITDFVVWFKNVHSEDLLRRLNALEPDEMVTLDAESVVGQWCRMKASPDGRPTPGIRPVGTMKAVWGEWYRNRRGERITLRPVTTADEYLSATTKLFSEWDSEEDDEAFRDL